MLFPKNQKYKKQFKNKIKETTYRGNKILYGEIALKAVNETRLTLQQLEASKRTIIKKMRRVGFIWTRIFPDVPVTTKPNEVRMGKGKGAVNFWVAKVLKGQIIFEISGLSLIDSIEAFKVGASKLPIKTKIVIKKGL